MSGIEFPYGNRPPSYGYFFFSIHAAVFPAAIARALPSASISHVDMWIVCVENLVRLKWLLASHWQILRCIITDDVIAKF